MKIIFLGVGEATEDRYPNNAFLILSETKMLLDCGYSVARQLWMYNSDPNFLDAIYITHAHADHYFGFPSIIVRMVEDKRKKPLTVICHKELRIKIKELFEYAYKGFYNEINFKINYLEAEEKNKIKFNEFKLSFSPTIHPVKNLAIRIWDGKNSVCYGGDGMFTKKTEKLYHNADLLIHEAYFFAKQLELGHVTLKDLIKMAKRNDVKCLALTHINRDLRKDRIKEIKKEISNKGFQIIVPEPLEEYTF